MAFYVIHKCNPYFKNGAIVELFEHGFQEAVMVQEGSRLKCTGNKGILHLESVIKPFCIKMLSKGFDKPGLRTKKSLSYGPKTDGFDPEDPQYGIAKQ